MTVNALLLNSYLRFIGDTVVFMTIRKSMEKPWVKRVFVPVSVSYGLAVAVSIIAIGFKMYSAVSQFRRREREARSARLFPAEISRNELQTKVEKNRFTTLGLYISLLVLLFEERPHCHAAANPFCTLLSLADGRENDDWPPSC